MLTAWKARRRRLPSFGDGWRRFAPKKWRKPPTMWRVPPSADWKRRLIGICWAYPYGPLKKGGLAERGFRHRLRRSRERSKRNRSALSRSFLEGSPHGTIALWPPPRQTQHRPSPLSCFPECVGRWIVARPRRSCTASWRRRRSPVKPKR